MPTLHASDRTLLRLCFLVLLSSFSVGELWAQEALIPVGSRVRVWTQADAKAHPSGPKTMGTVTLVSADTLVLQPEGSAGTTSVPLTSVTRLDVTRGPERWSRSAVKGGAIGATVGALLGVLTQLGPTDIEGCDSEVFQCDRERDFVFAAVSLGGIGAAAGAVIGIARGGERWERVPVPGRISIAPGRRQVALSTSFGF